MIRLRRRRPSAPVDFPTPDVDLQRAAVLDVVIAHWERGTRREDVTRALLGIAADSLEPLIRDTVEEVYGTRTTS